MLAAGAAEALQREAGGVVALLHRDLLDGVGHVGDGDAQEAFGHRARVLRRAGRGRDLVGQGGEFRPHHRGIERLVALRAEDRREMRAAGSCRRMTLASVTVSGPPRR